MKFTAIILAAGSGQRTGLDFNKVLVNINGKRVLDYSIKFFEKYNDCNEIILVCSERDFNYIYNEYKGEKITIIVGGLTRQQSVFKGLNKAVNQYVFVHDSARPFINMTCFDDLWLNLQETKANTLAVKVTDSIVESSGNRLGRALDRSKLLSIQTPQGFLRELLLEAHVKALKSDYSATDDTDLISKFTKVTPAYVIGDYRSIKLTTKEDIELLKVIL